ncbi:MAG: hypothetical protein RLO21_05510 [Nitratireductor sp.]
MAFGLGRVEDAERHIDRLVIDKPARPALEIPNLIVGRVRRTEDYDTQQTGGGDAYEGGMA